MSSPDATEETVADPAADGAATGDRLLTVDGVDAYYGQSHILRDLSLHVEEGEVCTLLGRNGAGKTTTLRAIAGARPPDVRSGSITVRGTAITR